MVERLSDIERETLQRIADDPDRPWRKNEVVDVLREKGYVNSWPAYTRSGQRFFNQPTMRGLSALKRQ